MVTAAPPKTHAHKFEIKGTRGICPCGEIREYSGDGKDMAMAVVQKGNPDYKDRPGVQALVIPAEKIDKKYQIDPAKSAGKKPTGKTLWLWFDERKEQILKDYQEMYLWDFLKKWCSTTTWQKLKQRWGITGKYPRRAPNTSGFMPPVKVSARENPLESIPDPPKLEPVAARLVEYWRKRAAKCQSESERMVIELTIEALEGSNDRN